jgi:hypothetical protein
VPRDGGLVCAVAAGLSSITVDCIAACVVDSGEAEQQFCFVTVMGVGPRLSASVNTPQDTMSNGVLC